MGHIALYPVYLAPVGVDTQTKYTMWNPQMPAIDIGIGYGNAMPVHNTKEKRMHALALMDSHFSASEASRLTSHTKIRVASEEEFWATFPAGAESQHKMLKEKYD